MSGTTDHEATVDAAAAAAAAAIDAIYTRPNPTAARVCVCVCVCGVRRGHAVTYLVGHHLMISVVTDK